VIQDLVPFQSDGPFYGRSSSRGPPIAIDDFGCGNSSLNHLRHLPIDEVKLDRSLSASITEDPRVAAIVRSIIDLSHNLGLTTVAEGVETSATAAMLTGYGCDIAQGHHYSQSLSAPQILDLLANRHDCMTSAEASGKSYTRSTHASYKCTSARVDSSKMPA
jgi:diguanylate cyclase